MAPGDNGRTSLTLPNALGTGRGYFWRAKAQDGANTGPYSSMVAFNVFTPVSFDKPMPVSPVGGAKVSTYTPEFVFNNAPRTGSPGLITYVIEVATNSTFGGLIAAWQFAEQANQTKFTAASGLPPSSQLYWRVRAFEATALGPWSDTGHVRDADAGRTHHHRQPAAEGGGGACTNTTQFGIVTCRETSSPGTWTPGQSRCLPQGCCERPEQGGHVGQADTGCCERPAARAAAATPATSSAAGAARRSSSGTSSATRTARRRRTGADRTATRAFASTVAMHPSHEQA